MSTLVVGEVLLKDAPNQILSWKCHAYGPATVNRKGEWRMAVDLNWSLPASSEKRTSVFMGEATPANQLGKYIFNERLIIQASLQQAITFRQA